MVITCCFVELGTLISVRLTFDKCANQSPNSNVPSGLPPNCLCLDGKDQSPQLHSWRLKNPLAFTSARATHAPLCVADPDSISW